MKKIILSCFVGIVLLVMVFPIYATELADGAYTISRKTSYVNPETGKTVDGGTNIALGDSMCASIVEDNMLLEKSNGKTYITIGIGLMSNIQNVKIQVRDENGTYKDAQITQTGSCQRTGDVCNHYRFEVPSADSYISPILYVTPMGRDVQFFVIPDLSTAKEGTGNFVSQMITESSTEVLVSQNEQPSTQTDKLVEPKDKLDKTQSRQTSKEEDKSLNNKYNNNVTVLVISGILVVSLVGIICYVAFSKRKQNRR